MTPFTHRRLLFPSGYFLYCHSCGAIIGKTIANIYEWDALTQTQFEFFDHPIQFSEPFDCWKCKADLMNNLLATESLTDTHADEFDRKGN